MLQRKRASSNEEQVPLKQTALKAGVHEAFVFDQPADDLALAESGMDTSTEESTSSCQDDENYVEEEMSLYQRIPFGLALALLLFSVGVLTCLRIVYLYLCISHSWYFSLGITSMIALAFGLSTYIIANTFYFTHLDFEHAQEEQEKARALLLGIYPEHVLQRLLTEGDDENEEEEDEEQDIHTLGTGSHVSLGASLDASSSDLHKDARETSDDDQLLITLKQQERHLSLGMNHYQQAPLDQSEGSLASAERFLMEDQLTDASHPYLLQEDSNLHNHPEHHLTPSRMSNNVIQVDSRLHIPISDAITSHRTASTMDNVAGAMCCQSNIHHHPCSSGKNITDLFPSTTIFYAEIIGFTAWSSQRSPNQVFELLESIFGDLDDAAVQGGILKIESMQDAYLAVTGLPEADPNHSVRMAQFASDCLNVFSTTTKQLERSLGPDTSELQLRIGLHSGPVTAGILKGQQRFQLFGDTVNSALRVAKQGLGNRVHVTRETAELLEQAGKYHWIVPREKSEAGKTFWLTAAQPAHRRSSCSHAFPVSTECSHTSDNSSDKEPTNDMDDDHTYASTVSSKSWTMHDLLTCKEQRLIEWTVDQLALMLKKIVARRRAIQRYEARKGRHSSQASSSNDNGGAPPSLHYIPRDEHQTPLDEVKEMIVIPRYKSALLLEDAHRNYNSIELPERVVEELTNFVSTVTTFYYDEKRNPFHNYKHASHVLMSVVKMMERIISPSQAAMEREKKSSGSLPQTSGGQGRRKKSRRTISWEELHDHTFGLTTDPLTQFAVVFAALIHDLDHPGVPNAQLVKEQTRLARVYKNRSISEQNSLDMAWDLLMDPSYQRLVQTICSNQEELKRFRQLLVQTVMATDIADAELRKARNERWDKAFAQKPKLLHDSEATSLSDLAGDTTTGQDTAGIPQQIAVEVPDTEDDKNRKATIILEHLLQASGISHAMQHWDVFRKWNEKLFREMYLAFLHGRAEKDPADFWYKGEIGFFKFYIIPLAKKLSDCGVFGVSSDEYLNYAQNNLCKWEVQGEAVVKEMHAAVLHDYGGCT